MENKTSPTIIQLSNGDAMPLMGCGTFTPKVGGGPYDVNVDDDAIEQAVCNAIRIGYRHFDCAFVYGNEKGVGKALREFLSPDPASSVDLKRSDLFVATKVWNTHHRSERVGESLATSLSRLQLDYVDLFYLHWPFCFKESDDNFFPLETVEGENIQRLAEGKKVYDYLETYAAMEKLVDSGHVRGIGLSNFNKQQIERVLTHCRIRPVALTVEVHVYLQQAELVEFCVQSKIAVVAFSPLAAAYRTDDVPRIADDQTLRQIGLKYGTDVTPQQVALAFLLNLGISVIPRSLSERNVKSNFEATKLILTPDDKQAIRKLDRNFRFCAVPDCKHLTYYPF